MSAAEPETALRVEGWTLVAWGEDFWIRDLDLADRAGMTQPRHIRPIIRKAIEDGSVTICDNSAGAARAVPSGAVTIRDDSGGAAAAVPPPPLVRREDVFAPKGNGAMQKTAEYLLNETAALLIITRLRTAAAIQLTRAVIHVFVTVRRGAVEGAAAAARALEQDRQGAEMQERFDAHLVAMQEHFDAQLVAMQERFDAQLVAPSVEGKLRLMRRDLEAGLAERYPLTHGDVVRLIEERVRQLQPALLVSQVRGAVMVELEKALGEDLCWAVKCTVREQLEKTIREQLDFQRVVETVCRTATNQAVKDYLAALGREEIRDQVRSVIIRLTHADMRDLIHDWLRRAAAVVAVEPSTGTASRAALTRAASAPSEDDTRSMVRWMAVQYARDDMREEIRKLVREDGNRVLEEKADHVRDELRDVRDEQIRAIAHDEIEKLSRERHAASRAPSAGKAAPATPSARDKFALACELMHEGANQLAAARGVGIGAKTLRAALREIPEDERPQPPPEVRHPLGPSALPRLKRQVIRNRLRALSWEPKQITHAIEWLGSKLESRPLDELLSEIITSQRPS